MALAGRYARQRYMFRFTLLAFTLGTSLQTVFVAMLVSMLGPSLALRGQDGSLHDAVLVKAADDSPAPRQLLPAQRLGLLL